MMFGPRLCERCEGMGISGREALTEPADVAQTAEAVPMRRLPHPIATSLPDRFDTPAGLG